MTNAQRLCICTLINGLSYKCMKNQFSGDHIILSDLGLHLLAKCQGNLLGDKAIKGGIVAVDASVLDAIRKGD
jgi:hypothetical protein